MPTPSLPPALMIEALRAVAEHGTQVAAARALGIPRGTLQSRVHAARDAGMTLDYTPQAIPACDDPPPDLSELVDDLPEYGAVKKRLSSYNQAHIDRFYSERNVHLRVPHGVFLQFFIGDLHRDSPGHDDDQFEADMGVIRRAQEAFPCHVVNMGDILDHWPTGGRLGKKHHHSHLTRKESLALVRGFLQEEQLNFAVHLLGNHDEWPGEDFATLMRQWTNAPVVDWAAYLHVTTDRGFRFLTFASHDMKGSSIHNPVHGLSRRAREDGSADLYVAAHRHTGGQGKDQAGFRSRTYNYLRVRGYKRADEYAWRKGFAEEEEGAMGLAVINPDARMQDGRVRTFYDLEEGLDWARFLSKRK